jgi:hypothetical protein
LFLKRANRTPVEHIAAGTNGRAQHSMYLCWGYGKVTCHYLKGMLDHPVIGTHTTGMHQRNHRGVKSIQHDGQAVGDQYAQRHVREIGHQRIRCNACETALPQGRVDNTYLVAVHLAHGAQGHVGQAHRLQHVLPLGQDRSTFTPVKAQIERLSRTPGVPGRKGASQAGMGTQRERFKVGNRACLAPE